VFSLSIVVKLMSNHFAGMVFAWKQDVAKSNWPKSKHQQQFGKSNTTRDQCGTLMRAHNTDKTSINDACLGHVTWRKRSGGYISRIFRLEEKLFIYVQIKQSIFECKFGNLQQKLFLKISQWQQWLGWTWNKLDPWSYMIRWHIYVNGPLNNLWPWFAHYITHLFYLLASIC
jgi:hypothetical protein